MSGHISKAWDWSRNTDRQWLVPCVEAAYLAERWSGKGFSKFLDLGCGLGRHSVYMAGKGFEVSAVDLSREGVEHLEGWTARERLSIKTAVCDMHSLPFEEGAFDCVMAYNVIYHTDTKGFISSLAEIARVMRARGELFLTLISKNTYGFRNADRRKMLDPNTLLRDEEETGKDIPHFHVGIEDISRLFEGWKFERTPLEHCEYNLDNPEYYSRHWTLLLSKGDAAGGDISPQAGN